MRLPIPTLVLLMQLAAAPLAAAPPVPAPPVQTPPSSAPATDPGMAADGRQKASAPAATFTPSEKIKADSAVAFPVDI
jgi:hypothetical protein